MVAISKIQILKKMIINTYKDNHPIANAAKLEWRKQLVSELKKKDIRVMLVIEEYEAYL